MKKKQNNKWVAQIRGSYNESGGYEISVINTEKCFLAQNYHGWYDENKILIGKTDSGYSDDDSCQFDILCELAEKVAKGLNIIDTKKKVS